MHKNFSAELAKWSSLSQADKNKLASGEFVKDFNTRTGDGQFLHVSNHVHINRSSVCAMYISARTRRRRTVPWHVTACNFDVYSSFRGPVWHAVYAHARVLQGTVARDVVLNSNGGMLALVAYSSDDRVYCAPALLLFHYTA